MSTFDLIMEPRTEHAIARADYSILRRPKMTALGENGTPEQKLLLGAIPRW